jgi:ABC-type nitrate/sulfonate/bicarbonate transport system substrate-binding protein
MTTVNVKHTLNRRAFGSMLAAAAGSQLLAPAPVFAQATASVGSFTLGWVKSTANLMAPVSTQIAPTYGLTIESSNFNTAQDILTAMIAGQIDVGLLTPIHLIRSIDLNLDYVQIAGNARGGTGVVAAKSLNLGKDDWAGFKKLAATRKVKVVSSRGSVNEALAIAEMQKNGIDLTRDVDLTNIANFGEHLQALRSGDFDMIVTIEPVASLAVIQGVGTTFCFPYSSAAGNLNTNFVVSRKWLATNGPKAQAFVNALRDSRNKLVADAAFRMQSATQLTGLAPNVITLSLANTTFDLANGLKEMQALAKIAVHEKYAAKDVSDLLPGHVEDRFLHQAKA